MAKDPERVREYNKQYWARNKDRLAEKKREKVRQWRKKNKDRMNLYWRQRRQEGTSKNHEYNRRSRLKVKVLVIATYGGACACCGEREIEFLTLDHVDGGGTRHRKTPGMNGGGASWRRAKMEGFPPKYRILCFNCNFSAYLGDGICIHKRQTLEE